MIHARFVISKFGEKCLSREQDLLTKATCKRTMDDKLTSMEAKVSTSAITNTF